jgi:hypothetical protein
MATDAVGTSGVKRESAYAILTLNVDSNLNDPELIAPSGPSYQATVEINEDIGFAVTVYDANAIDNDLTVNITMIIKYTIYRISNTKLVFMLMMSH